MMDFVKLVYTYVVAGDLKAYGPLVDHLLDFFFMQDFILIHLYNFQCGNASHNICQFLVDF